MKVLLVLVVLGLAGALSLDPSENILKELEDLIGNKEANDKPAKPKEDSAFEELIKVLEQEDQPLTDEEFEREMELEENDPVGPRGHGTQRRKGDNNCNDSYGKCKRFRHKCHAKYMKRKCRFTCQYCYPEDCRDSLYGCCNRFSTVRADGEEKKGCAEKLCYDRTPVSCEEHKLKCEDPKAMKNMKFDCQLTCGLCKPPTEAKCKNVHGWGCCESPDESSTSATGPKLGCSRDDQFFKKKLSIQTCKDKGHGCCRSDGSRAATSSKRGCTNCEDTNRILCRRFKTDCKSTGGSIRASLRQLCKRTCGFCVPS